VTDIAISTQHNGTDCLAQVIHY